jgi:long-chain acyl-CoA synthetase
VKKGEVAARTAARGKQDARPDDIFAGLTAGAPERGAKLSDDLGLDSLDMVELVVRLEKRYGVSLDETIIGPDTTVGEIEDLASHTPVTKPAGTVFLPMPRWVRRGPARLLRRLLTGGIVLPGFRFVCPIDAEGVEHLNRIEGPRILCANHQSDLDPLALLLALPPRYRRRVAPAMGLNRFHAYFTHLGKKPEPRSTEKPSPGDRQPRRRPAKKTVRQPQQAKNTGRRLQRFSHRLAYGIVTLLFQTFPFPQGAAYRPSMEYAGELLDAGLWLLIFPEGRVSEDGGVGVFKGGVSLIAERTDVPVVPVSIDGMQRVLPPGRRLPRRGRVRVSFGEPLNYTGEEHERFAKRIEVEVRRMQHGAGS